MASEKKQSSLNTPGKGFLNNCQQQPTPAQTQIKPKQQQQQQKQRKSSLGSLNQPRLHSTAKRAIITPKESTFSSLSKKKSKQPTIESAFKRPLRHTSISSSSSSRPPTVPNTTKSRKESIGRQIFHDPPKKGCTIAFDPSQSPQNSLKEVNGEERKRMNRVQKKLPGKTELDFVPEQDWEGFGERAFKSSRGGASTSKLELDLGMDGDDSDAEQSGEEEEDEDGEYEEDAAMDADDESVAEPDTLESTFPLPSRQTTTQRRDRTTFYDNSDEEPVNPPSPIFDEDFVLAPDSDAEQHSQHSPSYKSSREPSSSSTKDGDECARLAELTGAVGGDDSGYASQPGEHYEETQVEESQFNFPSILDVLGKNSESSLRRSLSAILMPPPPANLPRQIAVSHRAEARTLAPDTQDDALPRYPINPVYPGDNLGETICDETQEDSLPQASTSNLKASGWTGIDDAWSGQTLEPSLPPMQRQTTLDTFFGVSTDVGQRAEESQGSEVPIELAMAVHKASERRSSEHQAASRMQLDDEEDEIVEDPYDWSLMFVPSSEAEENNSPLVSADESSPPSSPEKPTRDVSPGLVAAYPSRRSYSREATPAARPHQRACSSQSQRPESQSQWESYWTDISLPPVPREDDYSL